MSSHYMETLSALVLLKGNTLARVCVLCFLPEQVVEHTVAMTPWSLCAHDDVIKWKHFPRYWHFVRGIHRSPVNSPHKGQWRVALMFSLIYIRINGWVNNREAGNLRRHRAHYDVIAMVTVMMNTVIDTIRTPWQIRWISNSTDSTNKAR